MTGFSILTDIARVDLKQTQICCGSIPDWPAVPKYTRSAALPAHRGAPARDRVPFGAQQLLAHWDEELANFRQVCPKEMLGRLEQPLGEARAAAA
jgi:hypothetical protein